ncbi:MAG TPA: MMPL family transporter [Actinomycetales bacterium]|nr:MMPL family transporter [Actinomycetales bacterium]
MRRLGRHAATNPVRIILGWVVLVALSLALAFGAFGPGLFSLLSTGAPSIPGSEAKIALDKLEDADDSPEAVNLVVTGLDLADQDQVMDLMAGFPAIRESIEDLPGVEGVQDPFASPQGPMDPAAAPYLSVDADGFVVRADLAEDIADAEQKAVEQRLREVPDALGVAGATGHVSSTDLLAASVLDQVKVDLLKGEVITVPISFVVMIVVFGGFIAAGMPIIGALASIATGMAVVWAAAFAIDIDSYIVNLLTIIGLALSIDYGLLVVSRFREELGAQIPNYRAREGRRRRDPAVVAAIETTVATAGRTVLFSAITIAIAIAGLLFMKAPLLQAVSVAGSAVVLLAVLSAVTLVPALLSLLGRRLARPSPITRIPVLGRLFRMVGDVSHEEGAFSKLARWVHRYPWPVMLVIGAILATMAYPLLHVQLRSNPMDYIPDASHQRAYLDVVDEKFPLLQIPDIYIVTDASAADTQAWADELAGDPLVERVNPVTELTDGEHLITLKLAVDSQEADALQYVRDVRDHDPGFANWVGGAGADMHDFTEAIVDGTPWAVGAVIAAVFVLLFLMTGSLVIPFKALVVNILSLAASLGVTVAVFQDGYLHNLLDFRPQGGIEVIVIALVASFGFGLAMDYEVFLIARVKEYWDATRDNDLAVERGLQKSGRIITSAALIMMFVFTGLIFGDLIVIKEVGFALALTVLVDATLVRLLLVPATMTLLGRYNWWAPAPLRRLHERFGISEH